MNKRFMINNKYADKRLDFLKQKHKTDLLDSHFCLNLNIEELSNFLDSIDL